METQHWVKEASIDVFDAAVLLQQVAGKESVQVAV